MNKQELIQRFHSNHLSAANYICALSDSDFIRTQNGKWSAGQQLAHLHLCLIPISLALSSADLIREKFGTIDRATMDYDMLIAYYKQGLANGGKAPERFLPAEITIGDRDNLRNELTQVLSVIAQHLNNYSDEQLDTLALPHPFLGKLSIRELFFLMSYHPVHHLEQVRAQLQAT